MAYCTLRTTSRFNFGKYQGELCSDIIEKDPQYLAWAISNTNTHPTQEIIDILKTKGFIVSPKKQYLQRVANGKQPQER